ncbi:MAG: methyl-accepting chemotaxis protein, partial [Ruminiclostridium sp.]
LIDTVHELDNISSSAALANRSIAEQSESVMRDSVENAEHIRSVDDSMNMISESLKRLSEMSLRIAALTRSADEITAENDRKISEAATSMDEICNGTNESKEIIFNLSEQSKRIEAIVDVITDISFQTNILALNASVEAAHAEEYGKGFAVVAGEIKKLSEQTKEAAAEIGDIIDHVTSNISATVKAMEKNAALTMEGKEGMENIKASAARISTSNSEISKNISDMNDVISTVAENGTAVLRKLESVSGNISNNCAAIENMAAAIEETSAGTETLGSMVKDISVMAEELERLSK